MLHGNTAQERHPSLSSGSDCALRIEPNESCESCSMSAKSATCHYKRWPGQVGSPENMAPRTSRAAPGPARLPCGAREPLCTTRCLGSLWSSSPSTLTVPLVTQAPRLWDKVMAGLLPSSCAPPPVHVVTSALLAATPGRGLPLVKTLQGPPGAPRCHQTPDDPAPALSLCSPPAHPPPARRPPVPPPRRTPPSAHSSPGPMSSLRLPPQPGRPSSSNNSSPPPFQTQLPCPGL